MAIGNIYRVALVGAGPSGQELVNVFHYRALDATIVDTQAEDLAQAFAADALPLLRACFSISCGAQRIEVRGVTDINEGIDYDLAAHSVAGAGTQTGEMLPPTVAALVLWRTGLFGRKNKGRTFVWPSGEGVCSGGVWTEAMMTALNNFGSGAIAIGDGVATSHYEMVVHSKAGNFNHTVVAHTAMPSSRTQKRRRPGVGA